MSDFWARRLNNTPQPAAQPSVPSTTPWWATPAPPPVPTHQPVPQQQEDTNTMAAALASNAAAPAQTKAKSARMTETCPECGSGNYFAGQTNSVTQCYECGYNPRFTHSTAGVGIPSDAGAPTPAKQLNPGGVSNFNPGTIVAHI